MIYIPKHFTLPELFPPSMLNCPEEILWGLFDERLLITLDAIRDYFEKPVYVNYAGMHCRGFRDSVYCKDVGAKYSMHRRGMAVDFNVQDIDTEEVRQTILQNQNKFPHIKRMERGVPWIHFDLKPTCSSDIVLFNG